MAVSSGYLATQIRFTALRQVVGYREFIFREVLPAFDNLEDKANKIANEYFNEIGNQPATDDEALDMADVAEVAEDMGQDFYEMASSIRQTMFNLLAIGLFHLVEQQLAHSAEMERLPSIRQMSRSGAVS